MERKINELAQLSRRIRKDEENAKKLEENQSKTMKVESVAPGQDADQDSRADNLKQEPMPQSPSPQPMLDFFDEPIPILQE